jgi:propanol-preferring alcohol dehydrogenase
VWNALRQADLKEGDSVAIVGIGGLGVLGIQFAKAMGYRTVAIDNREIGLQLAAKATLKSDLVVGYNDPEATKKISEFTDGIGLTAVVVCTDNVPASNWSINLLQPRGTCVVLGLPDEGYRFDAFALVFREIIIKGSLHAPRDAVEEMLQVVVKHQILSHLTTVRLEDAEALPEKVAAHDFEGRLVVLID